MSIRETKRLLLAKPETVYGTDPVPTGAANAMIVRWRNMPEPSNSDYVDRASLKPWLGRSQQFKANAKAILGVDFEGAGSGAAGTAPAWGVLMRGCGFGETIVAATSVAYSPISAAEESLTCYYNLDGLQQKVKGFRGSLSFSLKSGDVPLFSTDGTGLYAEPTDTSMPAPTFTPWKDPLVVNKANTTTLTLHGYACALRELNLNMNQDRVFRDWVNVNSVELGQRQPGGSFTIELPTIASKNYFAIDSANTLGALAITHGTVAGNILAVAAPKVQLMNLKFGSEQGITLLSGDLALVPNAGNDEVTFTLT